MSKYPKESNSQRIGRDAVKLFSRKIPTNWIEKELDGDSDYGLDFMVQYKEIESNLIKYKFHVQLKGTENNDKITENEIKIQIKTSTLNYYKNMGLVLFVICDLNQKECYYEYVHNILDSINLKSNQSTHSIKIFKKNILDRSFEIVDILKKWAEKNQTIQEEMIKEKRLVDCNKRKENYNKITIDFYTGIK